MIAFYAPYPQPHSYPTSHAIKRKCCAYASSAMASQRINTQPTKALVDRQSLIDAKKTVNFLTALFTW